MTSVVVLIILSKEPVLPDDNINLPSESSVLVYVSPIVTFLKSKLKLYLFS